MKKVVLEKTYKEKNGSYAVYLGNGTKHNFTSNKAAQHFLNNTGKHLNDCLYSLRKPHKDISYIAHDFWGFFDDTPAGSYAFLQRDIEALLADCNKAFDLCYKRSSWVNGNYFAFIHLYTVCRSLKNAVSLLSKFSEKKRITVFVYQFKPILENIRSVERALTDYGQDKATAYFTRPQHRDLTEDIEYKPKLNIA